MSNDNHSALDRWSGPIVGLAWLLLLTANFFSTVTLARGDYQFVIRLAALLSIIAIPGLLIGIKAKPVSTKIMAWLGWLPVVLSLTDFIRRWK